MPRRPVRSVPLLVLHGTGGPDPQAWYSWLAAELGERDVRTPVLPDSDAPVLPAWLETLDAALADLPELGFDVVAHDTGALLWLHHTARTTDLPRPERVALIAPPGADHIAAATFADVPLDTDAVRRAADGTVLVGGDDDPLCPEGVAQAYGAPLKMAATIVPGGGRLDAASGFGPWPAVLSWCNRDNLAFY